MLLPLPEKHHVLYSFMFYTDSSFCFVILHSANNKPQICHSQWNCLRFTCALSVNSLKRWPATLNSLLSANKHWIVWCDTGQWTDSAVKVKKRLIQHKQQEGCVLSQGSWASQDEHTHHICPWNVTVNEKLSSKADKHFNLDWMMVFNTLSWLLGCQHSVNTVEMTTQPGPKERDQQASAIVILKVITNKKVLLSCSLFDTWHLKSYIFKNTV